ncbi:MAG: hypothetical protein HY670_12860 [Chloroflexi bacterium]|nr:hypothetical protein [Chloroflexota bacterium]
MPGPIIRVTREMAQQRLGDVPPGKVFWVHGGRTIKNLAELKTALGGMSDDTYVYHANETKNDFANWVKDVLGDDKLAHDLQKSPTPGRAAARVSERIAWLQSKL